MQDNDPQDFKRKVKWLYIGRIVTIVPCFFTYFLIAYIGGFLPDIRYVRWMIILVFIEMVVNVPYGFVTRKYFNGRKEGLLISIMLSVDVLCATLALHFVGLQDGMFFGAIYLVTIIFAGILATQSMAYLIATFSVVCYGGLTVMEYFGIVEHIQTIGIKLDGAQTVGWAFSHFVFFYIVAYLSNFYSTPIRLRGEELYLWGKSLEKRLGQRYSEAITALIRALRVKDPYVKAHSANVAWYSTLIAKSLGLSDQMINDVRDACFLHDIGKIGISDEILKKSGKLTPEEQDIMRHHSEFGAEILNALSGTENVSRIILETHEGFDGSGYPRGLKGKEICLGAQIIAVADAFDVMVSRRPYKKPIMPDEAINIIKENRGKQFSPIVADCFCKIYEDKKNEITAFVKKSTG
jgi:putative nucleotidyltransferase with HDIG domain